MPANKIAAATASLNRVLTEHANSHPAALADALIGWMHTGSPAGRLDFDDQPALGKALWTLLALPLDLVAGGTVHFLRSMGSEARRLGEYAHLIGASAAEAYAADMVKELKRLNGRRLPGETQGAMGEAMDRLEDRDMRAGGTGLFESLDERYVEAVTNEIDERLPAFVRDHVGEIVQAYERHERPAARVLPAAAGDGRGHSYFSANPRDYDARARAWADRVAELPASALPAIAKRFNKAAGRSADQKVFQVWTDGPRVGRTEEEWRKTTRHDVSPAFLAAEACLQATLATSALPAPARRKVTEAFQYAARLLRHLPELERLPHGPALIATQLAPFEGLIPPWNADW